MRWVDLGVGHSLGGSISSWVRGAIMLVDEVGRSVGGFVVLGLELGWQIVGRQTVSCRTGARSVEAHRLACLALWSSVAIALECVCKECLECDCEECLECEKL